MTDTAPTSPATPMALDGIRVVDASRVLAAPIATQTLGDLGADVIKIERPGAGDDIRRWGPPFLKDGDGNDTTESAYYLGTNRNKRSITLDFTQTEGREILLKLLESADVFVENYKVGDLARYGLAYDQIRERFPRLVYASVTGFGQTGPYAPRPGYDLLAQAMGGIMSVTGDPNGQPTKVGVAIADMMTGMYTTSAILAALRHRDLTGQGQHIDAALLDTQVSWLMNQAMNYLVGGVVPGRLGNAHPNVAPYEVFASSDGFVILGCGADRQFQAFLNVAGRAELAEDPRFVSNTTRLANIDALRAELSAIFATRTTDDWVAALEAAKVPCGPVNTIDRVFADPQVQARGMATTIPGHALTPDGVPTVAYPLKLSETPATYRRPPPILGQHTEEVLTGELGLDAALVAKLRDAKVI
ncbi:CaiB/BaiF CoA-transferase family protein [Thalassobaculum sp. OXR-137]|uniref:CaiB/BaiF CoA transferase family protein n=1 Tax=Thalassobaculum sp. OXR-137 TaxID=3100173 RepID=UPI002AC9E8C7|nr:CaiB/BaiF CoA-transferase family protein [Thalassobaculum sp. OXR-137]WPZ33582.1 CaiB/BaiF CoA-transferase family protein [Thalassobaculum sp. OXR-137]